MPASTLYNRVRAGADRRLQPGVYRVAGAPDALTVRYRAAVLAVGEDALLSHGSAAHLWGLLPLTPPERIHVLSPGPRVRLDGVMVHRTRHLPADHRARHQGIPVTSVQRTLCDVSCQLDRGSLRSALTGAVRASLVSADEVARCLDEMGRIRGARVLRDLISELSPQEARAKSELESLFVRLTTAAGLPTPELNHAVVDAYGKRRLIDAAYVNHGVAVELDGRRWHGLSSDRDDDLRRQNALVLVGWRWFLRFTWAHLKREPDRVVDEVRSVLAAAEAEA